MMNLVISARMAAMSVFEGETLDTIAEVLAWVVLVIVPVVGIGVFWIVHILPEKIAEKRRHPQTQAIQTLCLLSLVFGGLLWPLAWLWAYSKPVFYKMAYGTDQGEPHGHDATQESAGAIASEEVRRVRERLNALSTKSPEDAELQEAVRAMAHLEAQLATETARGEHA